MKGVDKAEKSIEQLKGIHEIVKIATSSLDVAEVSERIVNSLGERFRLATASIFIVNEKRHELKPLTFYGYPLELLKIIPSTKLDSDYDSARVFRSGQPIVVEDIDTASIAEVVKLASRKLEELTGSPFKSYVIFPLTAYQRTIGTLTLTWPIVRTFSQKDIDFFMAVAHEIAIGLDNARIFGAQQTAAKTLETMMECTNAQIAYLDTNCNFILVNSSYAAGSGYTEEELIGYNHFELFPNLENEAIFKKVRDTGESIEYKAKPFQFANQPWRDMTYWDWTLTPIKDSSGQVIGLVLSLVDVTETIRAKQLSDALNQINATINSTRDFDDIMQKVVVEAAKAVGCNTASIEMRTEDYWEVRYIYGLPHKMLGMRFSFQESVGLEIMAKTKKPFAIDGDDVNNILSPRIIEAFKVGSMMLMPIIVKGNVVAAMRFVFHEAQVIFEDNQIDFATKLAASVSLALENARLFETERKRAEELEEHRNNLDLIVKERTKELHTTNVLLSQSEAQHRQIIEASPDAYFVFARNKILYANQATLQLFGYKKTEITTQNNLIIPEQYKELKTLLEKVKESQKPVHLGELTIGKEAFLSKIVDVTVVPVVFEGEIANQYIVRDITQRKEMEKEIARLDRLNLVGEMAAGIGHEVRNPMTCVRGFLQLLANKELDSKKIEYYDIMIEELDRANSIITEFLSLAKDKVFTLIPTSLNSIINSLYPLLSTDAMKQDKRIKLIKGDIPKIPVSEKEIRQLVLNLVRNGLEAMPSGTDLTIKTYVEDDAVVFYVQDEGSGIKPELLKKLGTPFVTTKDNGTGLGLAICYSIVERHNAKIDVKTGATGTTFYVRFKIPQTEGLC